MQNCIGGTRVCKRNEKQIGIPGMQCVLDTFDHRHINIILGFLGGIHLQEMTFKVSLPCLIFKINRQLYRFCVKNNVTVALYYAQAAVEGS